MQALTESAVRDMLTIWPKEISSMSSLQIKRKHDTNDDPKQVLRAHIDRLPPEKQREFIASALQLMAERTRMSEAKIKTKPKVCTERFVFGDSAQSNVPLNSPCPSSSA
jgi:hypothetical protein